MMKVFLVDFISDLDIEYGKNKSSSIKFLFQFKNIILLEKFVEYKFGKSSYNNTIKIIFTSLSLDKLLVCWKLQQKEILISYSFNVNTPISNNKINKLTDLDSIDSQILKSTS